MSRYNTDNPIGSADPRDRDDNSKNLDVAVNTEADSWTDRFGNERVSLAGAVDPSGFAQSALDEADRATAARDAAQLAALSKGYYPTAVEGEDDLSEGDVFHIVDGDYAVYYQISDDVAQPIPGLRIPLASLYEDNDSRTPFRAFDGDIYWGVANEDGEVALGLNKNHRLLVNSIGLGEAGLLSADSSEITWGVTNENGSVALGLDEEGATHMQSVMLGGTHSFYMDVPGIKQAVVDSFGSASAIQDDEGNWLFAGLSGGGGEPIMPITHSVEVSFWEPISDPSKELYGTWLSDSEEAQVIEYRPVGGQAWQSSSSFRTRPYLTDTALWLHTAECRNLSPDTVYEYRIPGSDHTDKVKTFPARYPFNIMWAADFQGDPLGNTENQALVGLGDVTTSYADHDLLLIGGDIVSDDGLYPGREDRAERWLPFLQITAERYRTRGESQMPWLAIIGNHDGANSSNTSHAANGGDGIPGPVVDVFTWSYDPLHENRFDDSVAYLRVRNEFLLMALETDHTVPMESQIDWFKEIADQHAPHVRHTFVISHVPPFISRNMSNFTRARNRIMRNEMWAHIQQYESARAWLVGHTHALTITPQLRVEYDDTLSDAENDLRWAVSGDGVRQIGNGPWGIQPRIQEAEVYELVSSIDGSTWLEAMMHELDGEVLIEGEGVTNADNPISHIWSLTLEESEFYGSALKVDGDLYFNFSDTL